MTNDLFRDLLDGPRTRPRPKVISGVTVTTGNDRYFFAVLEGMGRETWGRKLPDGKWTKLVGQHPFNQPQPPTDPRARALQRKQHQGHGPKDAPLRVRGRNNRYKEKH